MIENKISKDSDEDFTIAIDYTNREPILSSATLDSGTVTAVNVASNQTDETVIASTTATISTNEARVRVQSGKAGQDYIVIFTSEFSNGDTLQDKVLLKINDA